MEKKIIVLEKHIAELIAAGEVVDRPASVVKELVENAIDAGADNITVEIQNGGVSLIRVTDNGCGMSAEDLPKAFLRHATSKISTEDDLERILTFGFRGEALASIAAVSHTEILTREKGGAVGAVCRADGSEIGEVSEAGCPEGTTVLVRDLFYNTPARQKFLKKDVAEGTAVSQIMDRLALSYPEVKFRFIRDGDTKLLTPGNGDLEAVLSAVYGRDFAKECVPVDYSPEQAGYLHVSGYITKPSGCRTSRAYQLFFVNRRFVKTRTAMAAVEEAFKGSSMVGKYPGCVLNLTIPPEAVDVNVHPAKTEVRFQNEKSVFDLVYYGVKSALSAGDHSALAEDAEQRKNRYLSRIRNEEDRAAIGIYLDELMKPVIPKPFPNQNVKYHAVDFSAAEFNNKDDVTPYHLDNGVTHTAQYKVRQEAERAISEGREIPKECAEGLDAMKKSGLPVPEVPHSIGPDDFPMGRLRILGEVFGTYLVLESECELIFIDKHAAHERILYERLKSRQDGAFDCQLLLEPVNISLSDEEKDAALEHADVMRRFGFTLEDFGRGAVIVRTLPFWVKPREAEPVIAEIADSLAACKRDLTPEKLDRLYANIACRAAVKANDKLFAGDFERIVNTLLNEREIKYCPHGRPITVSIPKGKLERMFGRQQ